MRILPPPSMVELVIGNLRADAIWKKWLSKLAVIEDYTEVDAFSNSWVNVGSPHYNAAYYQDNYGVVRLRGRIGSGTSAAVAFVLPEGYRPTAKLSFGVDSSSGVGPGGTHGAVEIDSSGNVTPIQAGVGPQVSLDCVSFRAEQ